jgi:hypothetical protein
MIATVFFGTVRAQETLSTRDFIVHEGLSEEHETEPGNPCGSF